MRPIDYGTHIGIAGHTSNNVSIIICMIPFTTRVRHDVDDGFDSAHGPAAQATHSSGANPMHTIGPDQAGKHK
jgi:hypothetical protein